VQDRKPKDPGHDWHGAVSDAVDDLAETESAVAAVNARQRRGRAATYTLMSLPVLVAVVAWNVWSLKRPPEVLPDAEIASALRQTAGALAEEVMALQRQQGRLPTPAELGGYVDDELIYALRGEGFVITNTDGVLMVTYDGRMPVDQWVVNGGYTRVGGTP